MTYDLYVTMFLLVSRVRLERRVGGSHRRVGVLVMMMVTIGLNVKSLKVWRTQN